MKTRVPQEVYDIIESLTDGISDEMTMDEIKRSNKAYAVLQTIEPGVSECRVCHKPMEDVCWVCA